MGPNQPARSGNSTHRKGPHQAHDFSRSYDHQPSCPGAPIGRVLAAHAPPPPADRSPRCAWLPGATCAPSL